MKIKFGNMGGPGFGDIHTGGCIGEMAGPGFGDMPSPRFGEIGLGGAIGDGHNAGFTGDTPMGGGFTGVILIGG